MAVPKNTWVEGEYFTPDAANIVATAVVDLQNQITTLNNRNTITELESTATAGGTTTLTIVSKPIQEFTGTLTQTVKLPTTSVPPGAQYTIVNNSTGSLTIQTSTAAALMTLVAGSEATFISLVSNPTTAVQWQFINPVDVSLAQTLTAKTLTTPTLTTPVINGVSTGTGVATAGTASTLALRDATGVVTGTQLASTVATGTAPLAVASTTVVSNLNANFVGGASTATAATANSLAQRDGNANLNADNFINVVETTATAAGTTTLTIGSGGVQVFTGTTTQTVVLPTTGVLAGVEFQIINQSTGALTIQSSALAGIVTLPAAYAADLTALQTTPTAATHWRATLWPQTAGVVATTSNSLAAFNQSTSNAIGVGTIELGHASDTTLSRSAAGTLAVEGADVVTTTGAQAISGKTSITSTGAVTGSTLVSNVAQGTAPLTVTSNTQVNNLNAQWLGGWAASATNVANSVVARDANLNVFARGFIPGFTTTATAAGTTTLTIASNPIQEFTGTLAQTVALPTTGIVAGQQFVILNNSTGLVTVQSSALATIHVLAPGAESIFTALVATPTTAAGWEDSMFATFFAAGKSLTVNNNLTLAGTDGTTMTFPATSGSVVTGTASAAATGSTLALRDGNGLLFSKSFIPQFLSTATAAGTTTLAVNSNAIQEFTGTLTQTCVLPTTGVSAGQTFTVINNSTGAVTVQSSALATIGAALTTGQSAEFIALIATPTTAANWHRR